MRLRLSDTRSHAEEFIADTLSEFTLGLYQALQRYGSHFKTLHRPIPRPHLHLWPGTQWGKWIDAGYGRGTHIVLYAEMMQNTAYLSEIWERCQQAEQKSQLFSEQWSMIVDATGREARRDEGEAQ